MFRGIGSSWPPPRPEGWFTGSLHLLGAASVICGAVGRAGLSPSKDLSVIPRALNLISLSPTSS
ncbi:hypothetical protein [Desulfurococcus sp.]|uniref:hypothetical protein n=1 Tax=Desulfurococcus sp. TaxID=51678 RepID=UPI00319D9181